MIGYNKLYNFVDYVWDFYNPNSDLYPIKGITKQTIFRAIFTYRDRILTAQSNNQSHYTWGEGDSLDRERVRDIILEDAQFTLGN